MLALDWLSVLVAVLRPDGAVMFANAALEQQLGMSRRTLEGADFSVCFTEPALLQTALAGARSQDFEALRPYFSEREIVELSYAIGCINVWNRLCVGFAAPVEKKPITV